MGLANTIRTNRFLTLALISTAAWIAGAIWSRNETGNEFAFWLWFFGSFSFLLVVGYFSTPSNSIYGKIAFGFVVVMVMGIAIKILHLPAGNATILVGLLGIIATYCVMWLRRR